MALFEGLDGNGFDRIPMPPWQIVQVGGGCLMYLHRGDKLVVKSQNNNIATVKEVTDKGQPPFMPREFFIKGNSPGNTFIDARDPKSSVLVARLEVAVKDTLTLKIAFHFVEDKAGDKTNRQPDIVDDLIDELNKIYVNQTQIQFEKTRAVPVKVNRNLGDVVRQVEAGKDLSEARRKMENRFRGLKPEIIKVGEELVESRPNSKREWSEIVKQGDPTADFNVFFVPWVQPKDRNELPNLSLTIGNNCVIEDDGPQPEVTLPHEVGIFLGCPITYDPRNKRLLMFSNPGSFTPRSDNLIPKSCANTMYDTLRKLKP